MRRRERGTIAEALENVLGGLNTATKIRESLALAYWKQAVGPAAAAASEAESVRDGVLIVRTKSSTWSHELTLLKAQILERLNQRIGRPVIKDIRYRAQGIGQVVTESAPEFPSPDELESVRLTVQERAALEAEIQKLQTISDPKLREAVSTRLVRECKLRRWKLNHGWRVCRECTAVHNTDSDLCPICRVCR